jgi:hypothetical protein
LYRTSHLVFAPTNKLFGLVVSANQKQQEFREAMFFFLDQDRMIIVLEDLKYPYAQNTMYTDVSLHRLNL